jgi:hypothetical protein
MPLKCPRGTSQRHRVKTTKRGIKLRLGGCARKGKFVKGGVKEVMRLSD